MISLILLTLLSVLFLKFPFSFWIVGIAGVLVGFFFGGILSVLNILPVAILTVITPLVYSRAEFSLGLLLAIAINSTSLTIGYLTGALLATIFVPIKFLGKILSSLIKLFT